MLRSTPAVPHSTCFHAAKQYVFGRKNPFAFPPNNCVLLRVDFLSHYDEMTMLRSNSEAMRFWNSVWSCLKRETNLMQACSASQHQVIMPSWLSKVPSWLRKNALCLSQSAFSNFALHVRNSEITYGYPKAHKTMIWLKELNYQVIELLLVFSHQHYPSLSFSATHTSPVHISWSLLALSQLLLKAQIYLPHHDKPPTLQQNRIPATLLQH